MNDTFLTLAIHTLEKATKLKNLLEGSGIEVTLDRIENQAIGLTFPEGYAVKLKPGDLSRALAIMEASLSKENDKKAPSVDDGRRRILVAVDFSSYSLKACQVAFDIAKETNAKIKILHVYHHIYFPSHIPFSESLKEYPDEGLLDKTRKQMLNLCMEIDQRITQKEWPSVNYSYSLREGEVEEEIESFIREYQPALLIVGTKGKDNKPSSLLGNVTADLIEILDIPVLAIPENASIQSIKDVRHLAFLTSLQSRDINSFNTLVKEFIQYRELRITLMHVNIKNKEGEKWTETELQRLSTNFNQLYPQLNITYKLIDSPDIPQSVIDEVEKEGVNIICLNTRKRNLLARIFLPSVSRKMLALSNRMILVLRGT